MSAIREIIKHILITLTMALCAFAQSYSCGTGISGTLTIGGYTCLASLASFSQTANWSTTCVGQPIYGGVGFVTGSYPGISTSANGQCGTGEGMVPPNGPCEPSFYTVSGSSSITPWGTSAAYLLFGSFWPFCVNQSSSAGSPASCPAYCNECTFGVDACSVSGDCSAAAGYSCSSGCCVVGGDDGGGDGDGCTEQGASCDSDSECCTGFCDSGLCESEDPIVIDLTGLGYRLTSAVGGVQFDFGGTGSALQMSWTSANWNGGFLALDRNGNGRIDNAKELFSNLSPQPSAGGKGANGFLALAVYDQLANGGNGDGQIDEKDAIYDKLLLWVDRNHDGVSQPEELIPLRSTGIRALSLNYALSKWTDAFGNLFRYGAALKLGTGETVEYYDVLLQSAKNAGTSHLTERRTGTLK
jgi:hypothetical protein